MTHLIFSKTSPQARLAASVITVSVAPRMNSARTLGTLLAAGCLSVIVALGVPAWAQNEDISTERNKSGQQTRGATNLITPLKLDDLYLRNEIPGKSELGTITLKGAVQQAAVHNREVKEAKLEVSRFKWDFAAIETARLPNVQALSYLAQQTVSSELIPSRANAFVFLSALFPVTQQYRLGLEARVAKLARQIAAERLRQKIDDTTAKVKAAYYKLVLDQSNLADIQDSIVYLNELQGVVADQIKRGNSLKVEAMQVAAKLAKIHLDETRARNSYNIDCEEFNHLLGRDLKQRNSLETIPPPDELEVDVAKAEVKALSLRPEIHEAELRVRQVDAERKVILAQYIPDVSVGVVYVSMPGFNNQVLPKNALAPGIFIKWNALDWGRKAMLAKAREKVQQAASLTAQSARDEVLIDLHKQINKLTESRELVATAQLARSASREGMRVAINRYKHTDTKLSDVLLAQSELSSANNSYHEALLAFWQARAEFERAVGSEDQ